MRHRRSEHCGRGGPQPVRVRRDAARGVRGSERGPNRPLGPAPPVGPDPDVRGFLRRRGASAQGRRDGRRPEGGGSRGRRRCRRRRPLVGGFPRFPRLSAPTRSPGQLRGDFAPRRGRGRRRSILIVSVVPRYEATSPAEASADLLRERSACEVSLRRIDGRLTWWTSRDSWDPDEADHAPTMEVIARSVAWSRIGRSRRGPREPSGRAAPILPSPG